MEAAQRRQQRDAQKRQRELERQTKENAKLSAIEQARLEVETYENKLEVLLSVHKEQGEIWDWTAIAASIPPPCPQRNSNHELKTKQLMLVSTLLPQRVESDDAIEQARLQDEKEFQEALQNYTEEKTEQQKLKGPEDVLLLVEVADASLDYDREEKRPAYGRAGVPEVWIVNLNDLTVEIYRQPNFTGYGSKTILRAGDQVSPQAFPDVVVDLAELLKR